MPVIYYKNINNKPQIINSEILKANFKSLVFIVCIKKKYAKDFLDKGTIRFAKPSEWIPDNTSRGDCFEGVYASRASNDSAMKRILLEMRPQSSEMRIEDKFYYKSNSSCNMRAYCMYSLFDVSLHLNKRRSQDHRFHKVGKISQQYFHGLFPDWDKDKYEKADDDDKPMVLIIHPDNFVKKILSSLEQIGVYKDEILFQPIQYFDYKKEPFIINPYLMELFYKDKFYYNQHEVRFVINTKRKCIKEYFDNNDGILFLGPMDDSVATVSDFYFEDMQVEIRDNKLLYSLATPEISQDSPEFIVNYLFQTLSDELPESPLSIAEIENKIKALGKRLDYYDMKYDHITHVVTYNNKKVDIASRAGYKLLEHYHIYMADGDLTGAKETIDKFHYFFPMYDMGSYFDGYYKAINN